MLLRIAADKESVEAMRKAGPQKTYGRSADPLIELVNRMGAFSAHTHLSIKTAGLSMTIGRGR
jgi:hypothetical protein